MDKVDAEAIMKRGEALKGNLGLQQYLEIRPRLRG